MAQELHPGLAVLEPRRLPGEGIEVDALVGGSGPPLLLLHGYPQTRTMWHAVVPALINRFTLVIPDLRGYGRSDKPDGGPDHQAYTKRAMARDQIATMRALGFERFAVAGHDRGGRVGYRLALDHPEAVTRLAVLDIVPTAEMWRNIDAEAAVRSYHWMMLAQPAPLPEQLIGGDPNFFLDHTLRSWAGDGFRFDGQALAEYRACFRDPAVIHASCEDYRAGWSGDRAIDEADRGRCRMAMPLLVLWGEQGSVAQAEPLATWRYWAGDVRGHALPGGHFVAEEAAEAVATAFLDFFGEAGDRRDPHHATTSTLGSCSIGS